MKVYRLHESAALPEFATEGSAGFDLRACLLEGDKLRTYNPANREYYLPVRKHPTNGKLTINVPAWSRILVPTGLVFDIPKNHVVKLYIRSSMALKFGLCLGNNVGIIDSDYVDPVYMMIQNIGDSPVSIYHGERIAQGMLEKTLSYKLEETSKLPEKKTDRDGGLGSTGTA